MKHVDHIGIAVKSLATAIPVFEKLLNSKCYKTEVVDAENVTTAFLKTGETTKKKISGSVHGKS